MAAFPNSTTCLIVGRVERHTPFRRDPHPDAKGLTPPTPDGVGIVVTGLLQLRDPRTGLVVGYRGPGELFPLDRDANGRVIGGRWEGFPVTSCEVAWVRVRAAPPRYDTRPLVASDCDKRRPLFPDLEKVLDAQAAEMVMFDNPRSASSTARHAAPVSSFIRHRIEQAVYLVQAGGALQLAREQQREDTQRRSPITMPEPVTCRCTVCLCPKATERPSRICRACEEGKHPGLPRSGKPGRQAIAV